MNSSTNRFRHASGHTEMGHNKKRHSIAAMPPMVSGAVLMSFMLTAQAGKIISGPSEPSVPPNPDGFVADRFGGWNLDNVCSSQALMAVNSLVSLPT